MIRRRTVTDKAKNIKRCKQINRLHSVQPKAAKSVAILSRKQKKVSITGFKLKKAIKQPVFTRTQNKK